MITVHTSSRAGLLGNPSDAYFGRAIGVAVGNFAARARCEASEGLTLVAPDGSRAEFDSSAALLRHVSEYGCRGRLSLQLATVRHFLRYLEERGLNSEHPMGGFTLESDSDIPLKVGLAGSSALVIAMLRALAGLYGIQIPLRELPTLSLGVETRELGIHGGLMDRVVQVYGGVVYMDLGSELLQRDGTGRYESLDTSLLPPLFLAWDPAAAAGSELVHNYLRRRFDAEEPEVLGAMRDLAALADEGRELLLAGRGGEIGPLMDANFELRACVVCVGEGNRRLVETARRQGASAKQAGSGGAVIGTYDGDPGRLARLRDSYAAVSAHLVVPEVG